MLFFSDFYSQIGEFLVFDDIEASELNSIKKNKKIFEFKRIYTHQS